MTKGRKTLVNLIIALGMAYCGFLAVLYFNQRNMVFVPSHETPDRAAWNAGTATEVTVSTDDGLTLTGWYFQPKNPEKQVVLMFHGNAHHIGSRTKKTAIFREAGYGVLLAGYRGYGGNPGTPSERGLFKDARAYIAFLKEHGIQPDQLILYGESLGTAVAAQMAAEYPSVLAVVLESGFSAADDLAQYMYPIFPVRFLMKDRFRSVDIIKDIHAPLLVIHGEHDQIAPIRFARALYNAAVEPKTFIEIKGAGHNDLHDFDTGLRILAFLSTIPPQGAR